MLSSLIGAVVGRQTGGSAVKGAIAGKAATTALRFLGPVLGTAAVGFAAFKGWQKYKNDDVTDANATDRNGVEAPSSKAGLGSAALKDSAVN